MLADVFRLLIRIYNEKNRAMKKLRLRAKVRKFWQTLGPGLVTGASDDDPSGIATYSQAFARIFLLLRDV